MTFSDSSRSSVVISAPMFDSAVITAPGSEKISASNSAGFSSNSSAITTSAVRTTPLANSTGVSGSSSSKFVSSVSMTG